MIENVPYDTLLRILGQHPQAVATLHGSRTYSRIFGRVYFYQLSNGVLVAARITGLPTSSSNSSNEIFGFHIHSGSRCSGTQEDPFADTLSHYNPKEVPHPKHAGDLPPLFGNKGYAFQIFFTDRFSVQEILHRTLVVHSGPDDFTSQPAGNAGEKIACGVIRAFPK